MEKSHRDLKESHKNIVKRDKFLTQIWKEVKGIFKVIKNKERLPSSRVERDDESHADWLDTDAESLRERSFLDRF